MTKYFFIHIICCFFFVNIGFAQLEDDLEMIELNGEIVTMYITEDGDTLLLANLEDVSVSSLRNFEDQAEYRRYLKYRRYANVVFPYATEAIKIFRESEEVTHTMKKSKRKKHYKRLQKEMKEEFEEPLKKLTKTQGKILIKMIEKELDTPFYTLVRNLRGRVTASYWNTLGYMYGYRMKEGYTEGEDAVLDAVLHDFDISYQ